MYRHLFGPVPSRRLGLSLGIDLLADKTCSFDCVFCEVGRTKDLTLDRKEYVQPGIILGELSSWAEEGGQADHITLAGTGEPTLNTGFGDVIRGIRDISKTPVALLSNGSLFFLEEVRKDAAQADIVKLSLGAWNQESMDRLNRPYVGVDFEKIVDGYIAFREIFRGEMWLEVLLVEGINSRVDDVTLIAETVRSFGPDKVHLNTVTRPGTEKDALPVSSSAMEALARLFEPTAEVVVDFKGGVPGKCASVRELLVRRPCTLEDLANVTGLHREAVEALLEERAADWHVESRVMDSKTYFFIDGMEGKSEL